MLQSLKGKKCRIACSNDIVLSPFNEMNIISSFLTEGNSSKAQGACFQFCRFQGMHDKGNVDILCTRIYVVLSC